MIISYCFIEVTGSGGLAFNNVNVVLIAHNSIVVILLGNDVIYLVTNHKYS